MFMQRIQKKVSKLFYTLILLLVVSFTLNGQATKEDLLKIIDVDNLEHPYLFFTNEEKTMLMERIESDAKSKKIMEGLLAEGNRFLRMPFEQKTIYEPKHPRFGSYEGAREYVSEIVDGALTLSFLYQMTGNVEYAKKGIVFAIAISDLPEWVNAAHKFDIIYPRVWPWNVPDDQVVFSFDIHAAEKASPLAIAYDWLYPVLAKPEKDKIRSALLEKAITRVRGNYEFFWWSTSYRCNWAAVCYSGLGLTALSLLKDNPQLIDVVADAYNGDKLVFDEIGEDGGWQEGRGYFGKTLRESVHFMDALKRISKGKYNLFDHPKIKKYPTDFFLFGLTANFGDSEGFPVGNSFWINKFVEETGNNTGAWYKEKFVREGSDIFDIIWTDTNVKPIEPKQKSKYFRTINWAMMRGDFFDPSTVTIAAKAGYNDDPHHGHLDVGHFILNWYGRPFIRDIGRMSYDELYFNNERYDYVYGSSLGHNVVFVNGEEQIVAKRKNEPWKEGIGGEILDFRTNDERDYVLMDPTHAYPNKELKKWRRNIILEKPAVTVVLDEVSSDKGAEVRARFFPGVGVESDFSERSLARTLLLVNPGTDLSTLSMSGGEFKVNKDHVFLSDDKHNMAVIPLVLENDFTIAEDKIPNVSVTVEERTVWLHYFETIIKAKSNTSIIATLFVPVEKKEDAENIVKAAKISKNNSNEIEVTINTASQNYKWIFAKDKEGYILKE